MARQQFFRDHRGIQFRQCPECDGAGEHMHNRSALGDPQFEYTTACGACGGDGDWRVTRVDILETLADERRALVRSRKASPDTLAGWLAPRTERAYRHVLGIAVAPVRLPDATPALAVTIHPVFSGIVSRLAADGLLPSVRKAA